MSTPHQLYQQDLTDGRIKPDDAQRYAVEALDRVYIELMARHGAKRHTFFRIHKLKPVQGLYFWGGVGRGKTYLMDIFYHCLPFAEKQRSHFHRFMRLVHQKLRSYAGNSDPLRLVAKELASHILVLCFDEFVVIDIADAMILGQLCRYLFQEGVCIVTTSNFKPDHLYEDGLQRDLFLPAIEILKHNMDIVNVDSGVDYRNKHVALTQRYITPLTHEKDFMHAHFEGARQSDVNDKPLMINKRDLPVIAYAADVIWIDFNVLCNAPRSQVDYIDIADQFGWVLLSFVPKMDDSMDDFARRFMYLVDELYDSHKGLIMSSTVPIHELYVGKRLKFEFQRTLSRLTEMQSVSYGVAKIARD